MDHDMIEWHNASLERIADALERIADRLDATAPAEEKRREAAEGSASVSPKPKPKESISRGNLHE